MVDTIKNYLAELYTFYHVAKVQSFTHAAERYLDISKLQASRDVAKLEAHLGLKLLNRSTRKVSLTNDGAQLFEQAQKLIAFSQETTQFVNSIKTDDSPRFRLTIPESLGYWCIPKLIKNLPTQLKNIKIDFNLSNTQIDLDENLIDFAIKATKNIDDTLYAAKIGNLKQGFFVSKKLLEETKNKNNIDNTSILRTLPVISTGSKKTVETYELSNEDKNFSVNTAPKFNSSSFQLTKDLCCQSVGIAKLPYFLMENEIKENTVVEILKSYTFATIPLYLTYQNKKFSNPLNEAFKNHIIESLKRTLSAGFK
jgi:DNA-binding transcriptional LysR family regulator